MVENKGDNHQVDPVELQAQSARLAAEMLRKQHVRADRLFALLMVFQFVGAVLAALVISPRTWVGTESTIHIHVYAALGIGGLLAALPIAMAICIPGTKLSRHTIAVVQMLFSALLIHLTGGRIETHFHIFGSLALLSFYKDWKVLLPATITIAADHLLRGIFWPDSVFGVIASAPWRAFEHAGWVLFENVFLAYSCVQGAKDVRLVAERQIHLEMINETVERQVEKRTQELSQQTEELKIEIEERHRLESQLVQAQKLESIGQLSAGIAHEINTPSQYVRHNTQFLQQEIGGVMMVLDRYADLVKPDAPAMPWEQRAKDVKDTLEEIDYEFVREEIPRAILQSLEGMDRISEIIGAMKEFSHPGSDNKEFADINKAIQSTATVCQNRWKDVAKLEMQLSPDLPNVPCLLGELNQVILNIMVNGADAIGERFADGQEIGLITITTRLEGDYVEVVIADNGNGMPDSVREKIFDPFFTTKEVGKGTGQGLAISRDVVVQKHGGELECESIAGEGTKFIIRLPIEDPDNSHEVVAA